MAAWSIRLTASIAKFKEVAERSERLMYEQSHRDYLRSGYLHHRLARHGLLIGYRDNAITYKAQRDKNARELKLANAAITDMQMRQRMLLRSMQNTRRSQLMPKLKMMLCVKDVAAGRRRLHIKQSVSQCVKPSPPLRRG